MKAASAFPPGGGIEKADLGAAQWCFEHGRSAGRGADTLPGAPRLFLPLRTSRGVIGVVGLGAGRRSDILLTPDERRLLDALMDQAAVAIERVRLAMEMNDARVAAEAERLRSALLTSLSHDLKTPLASIVGAATSLCDYGERLDAEGRLELAKTIEEEGARMARFVSNLLDMTRLQAGAVRLTREPTDIPEIIGTAMRRTEKLLKDFKVAIEAEPDLPSYSARSASHGAGARQPARQRREICAALLAHHDPRPQGSRAPSRFKSWTRGRAFPKASSA